MGSHKMVCHSGAAAISAEPFTTPKKAKPVTHKDTSAAIPDISIEDFEFHGVHYSLTKPLVFKIDHSGECEGYILAYNDELDQWVGGETIQDVMQDIKGWIDTLWRLHALSKEKMTQKALEMQATLLKLIRVV